MRRHLGVGVEGKADHAVMLDVVEIEKGRKIRGRDLQHQIIAPYTTIKIGTVYSDASVGPTGTVLANQGYVMKFDS